MRRLFIMLAALLLLAGCVAALGFTTDAPVEVLSMDTAEPAATATRAAIQYLDFDPAQVGTLQSATLTWTHISDRSIVHTGAVTEPEKLRTLEKILSSAEKMGFISQCFETSLRHELTLVRDDGSIMTVLVAVDDCPSLRYGDTCYDFKSAAKTNHALYELFGAEIN
jgi:hypothetical protein